MLCHYCNHAEKVPEACPHCGSDHIQFLGTGSERVEDELHQLFPTARIARLDRDTASTKGAYERILQLFRAGDLDILVGTQMIAKGHDIANVTFVGVVLADIGLSMPDFRAAEAVSRAHAKIRERIAFMSRDRAMDGDVRAICELVASGVLAGGSARA